MEEYVLQNLEELNRVLESNAGDEMKELTPDIQRVPKGLARIGRDAAVCYVAPRAVPIGPYYSYRHSPELQYKTKIMKMAAIGWFLGRAGGGALRPELVVREAFEAIAAPPSPRGFYDDQFEDIDDVHFTKWMFQDGCFLLAFMMAMGGGGGGDAALQGLTTVIFQPRIDSIMRDIMLLENQIPWRVLEVLMGFLPVPVPVDKFLSLMAAKFNVRTTSGGHDQRAAAGPSIAGDERGRRQKPMHLLALFREHQVVGLHPAEDNRRLISTTPSANFSTAMELAEMGVHLAASKTGRFGDMTVVQRGRLFGKLFLAPVFLNDLTACWLVNMAAYEASAGRSGDDYAVSSYLYLVALLMNREDDVHQLRARCIVHSTFSNTQTLEFFKGLAPHLHFGRQYDRVLQDLLGYRRDRPVFVAVHKFLYNNFKTILTVLSIVGVIAPILQALIHRQN
ncbi:hypothetical protein PAHAL_2G078500 [Panicum hallii]|uniref:Uncharacterized protein n=1 Tax=Panicum hallii TaxID=206008 RepID=A0A2S3GX18_9POAL|nr:uncharacterized protein LOC112883329 [Panicum hallii]PAN10208.1 hypothetical protein PAHAL_2G078500 [Panicum hallii]